MNSKKWFFSQVIFWLLFWLILGVYQNRGLASIQENLITLFFQVGLIALLVFIISPAFLFKKKYLLLVLISILSIGAFSYSYEIIASKKRPPPRKQELQSTKQEKIRAPEINKIAGTILLSFTFLLALFLEGVQYTQEQEKLFIQSKNEVLESELKLLKSQINPHFIFNALNNIYALTVIDANKTRESITCLSDMLRYVLYECELPYVSPQKEVTYINNYLQLFALKSSKKYPVKMNSQVLDKSVLIAPMLLIPFVENALKHSHVEKSKDSFVNINLTVNSDGIHFEVENSIPAMVYSKDKTGGIGLKNVQKRLALLYPDKHQLELVKKEKSYKVNLNIKLTKDA